MKYVVALPQSNRVADPIAIRDVAQAAEELGYWGVSMHDHIVFDGRWLACGAESDAGTHDRRTVYEPITTFSYLAGLTTRVKLMFSVLLLPAREVVITAKQLAVLDQLSRGRVVLGVGVGLSGTDRDPDFLAALSVNAAVEMRTLKVPVTTRGRLVDEMLAAMHSIWTQDEASYAGSLVSFEGVQVFPKPAQPGGPPVYVAGNTEAALMRAARGGLAWLPNHATSEEVAAGLNALQHMCARLGTSAARECAINLFWRTDASQAAAQAQFPRVLSDALGDALPMRNLVGSTDDIVKRCTRYKDAGVTTVEMKPIFRSTEELIAMMDDFAHHVMPSV